jgi:ABC-2 type transport system ATP-binding protein
VEQENEARITVNGLCKRFGSTVALEGMTFNVNPSEVTGFVGPNGAGKSTTMRVILGLDAPDAGSALIGGRRYQDLRNPLRHVGALLDASALEPGRSGRNHLLWMAHSQGMNGKRVDEVIEQVGLQPAARRKARGYSLGMRQRLGIAAALLGDPPILMLDEPFNGMDPDGIIWVRRLLRSLASEGRAILVSSHLMGELEDIADHVVVIGRGKALADSSVSELIGGASQGHITLRTTQPAAASRILQNAGAVVVDVNRDTLHVSGLETERIVALLGQHTVPFSEVSAHRATLEEVYLRLTGGAVEYRAGAEEVMAR